MPSPGGAGGERGVEARPEVPPPALPLHLARVILPVPRIGDGHERQVPSQLTRATGDKVWPCGPCFRCGLAIRAPRLQVRPGAPCAAPSTVARRSVRCGFKSVTVRSWAVSVTGCSIRHAGGQSLKGAPMSYQQYPTSGQTPEPPQRPAAPTSVQTAVKLMYAGAALSLIELVVSLVTISSLKTAILKKFPHYTSTQVHSAEVAIVVGVVIEAVIAIGLWLWMARANGAGRNYARITGTVLFGVYTLFLLLDLRRPSVGIGLIFAALVWLGGLGAVIMLWRRESSEYFSPRAR